MGMTGKIPAAGSLLFKGRQYGMPNLAHMPLFFVYLPCCQLPGMSVSVYPEKLEKENIYSKFLNGTVLPKLSHNNIRDKLVQGCNLVLMWTTHGIPSMPGMNFQPNHFVPLVDFVANAGNQKKRISSRKSLTCLKLKVSSRKVIKILYLKVCILTTTTTTSTTTTTTQQQQQQRQHTLKLLYDFFSFCML